MGICNARDSTPLDADAKKAKQISSSLDNSMLDEHNADKQVHKLLLLGAGESGKSTLFKQMIYIYGRGFAEVDRIPYTAIIYNNVINSMKTLCKHSRQFGPVSPQNEEIRNAIEELKGDEEIDYSLGSQIQILWSDDGIQATYAARAKFQLPDSAKFFFGSLEEIKQDNYIPTQEHVLRARVRTTGIVENEFEIDCNKFKMFDVSRQRNERKKWIHCFENVTAVLFVAAIIEYDQVLYEDENTNRVTEALNLFEEICNSRWFHQTSMILFLNKRDLFEDKLPIVPLNTAFPEYSGDNSYGSACAFMRDQFENKNKNDKKVVYTQITCATDTNNIAAVFNAVKDIIIRQSLDEAGLV